MITAAEIVLALMPIHYDSGLNSTEKLCQILCGEWRPSPESEKTSRASHTLSTSQLSAQPGPVPGEGSNCRGKEEAFKEEGVRGRGT